MGLKRLNTFLPEETHRALKTLAASRGVTLPVLLGQLVESQGGDADDRSLRPNISVNLPASGSRPESAAADTTVNPVDLPVSGVAVGSQSSRGEINPDEIVRCERCGAELPQSAMGIHEENCAAAQQGYWDRTSFRG